MKYVIALVALVAAGYYFYEGYKLDNDRAAFSDLMDQVEYEPVNLFDAKNAIFNYAQVSCHDAKEGLEEKGSSVNDCLDYQQSYKNECETKIFRLAPMNFSDRNELADYGRRYRKCIMPQSFASSSESYLK